MTKNEKVNRLFVVFLLALALIIFLVLASPVQDSEYLKLRNQYHDECSEMVNDTIIESSVTRKQKQKWDREFMNAVDNQIRCNDQFLNAIKVHDLKKARLYCDSIAYYCNISDSIYNLIHPVKLNK